MTDFMSNQPSQAVEPLADARCVGASNSAGTSWASLGYMPITPLWTNLMLVGGVRYYDLRRHWTRRIGPHLDDALLNDILVEDFDKFSRGLFNKPFTHGMYPCDFDRGDWRCEHRGPEPRFWRYVAYGACHWLVNFSLHLANLAEPTRPWQILTSERHSTIWDGYGTLFELNYLALGIDAEDCFRFASGPDGRQLAVGHYRPTGHPEKPSRRVR